MGSENGIGRRALLRMAGTGAAAAATAGLAVALSRRKVDAAPAPVRMRDHRVERPSGSVQLAVSRGPDAAANVQRAIAALGGMGAFVRKGEKVVVKPNIGWNRTPAQAADTNPDVVAWLVREAMAAGASEVVVCDVPVNDADSCYERSGIGPAARAAGAKTITPADGGFRDVEVGGKVVRVASVLAPLLAADRIVNVPILKHHGLTGATMALKNWYGILGGNRARMHQEIHPALVDLALMMKPTLTVLDATRMLAANGPSGGNLGDVKKLDTIVAGTDEIAIDSYGAGLMNLNASDLGFIVQGEKAGLGRADWKSLKVVETNG